MSLSLGIKRRLKGEFESESVKPPKSYKDLNEQVKNMAFELVTLRSLDKATRSCIGRSRI